MKIKPFILKVAGYDISVLLIHEMVAWLSTHPMQAMVSLLGPGGVAATHSFWEAASKYAWGREHPAVLNENWRTGAAIAKHVVGSTN